MVGEQPRECVGGASLVEPNGLVLELAKIADEIVSHAFSHGFHAQAPLPDDDHLATFARLYNGPGAVESYVAMMKAAAARLP